MNDKAQIIRGTKNFKTSRDNILETERLYLIPLSAHSLELSLIDYSKMQTELGLNATSTILEDEEMQYVMNIRLKRVLENPGNYLWFTNWAIVHKKNNNIMGYIILKGLPNESGEVTIGYVIDEPYRLKGYALESIQKLLEWIFDNPKSKSVIADTEKDNHPSHKLLKRLGAISYKEDDELIWWRIEKIK